MLNGKPMVLGYPETPRLWNGWVEVERDWGFIYGFPDFSWFLLPFQGWFERSLVIGCWSAFQVPRCLVYPGWNLSPAYKTNLSHSSNHSSTGYLEGERHVHPHVLVPFWDRAWYIYIYILVVSLMFLRGTVGWQTLSPHITTMFLGWHSYGDFISYPIATLWRRVLPDSAPTLQKKPKPMCCR